MVRRAIIMIYSGVRHLRIRNKSYVYTVKMKESFQKKEFCIINKSIMMISGKYILKLCFFYIFNILSFIHLKPYE